MFQGRSRLPLWVEFVGQRGNASVLLSLAEQVIKLRRERAPQLLPLGSGAPGPIPDGALFDRAAVAEALRSTGHDPSKLFSQYSPRYPAAGKDSSKGEM